MEGQCSWLEVEFRQLARVENRASLQGWDMGHCSRLRVRLALPARLSRAAGCDPASMDWPGAATHVLLFAEE